MRNPIRLKNLRLRLLPLYAIGLAILVAHPPEPRTLTISLPLILAGTVLRSWGAGHLVKNDVLTTTGPYAHVRHPLYVGTILIGTGFALAVGGRLSLAVLFALWPWFALHYFPRKERSEAARLEQRYGERFLRYRTQVPALLPSLRSWRDESVPAGGCSASSLGGGGWRLDRYSENNELGTLLAIGAGVLVFWLRAVA